MTSAQPHAYLEVKFVHRLKELEFCNQNTRVARANATLKRLGIEVEGRKESPQEEREALRGQTGKSCHGLNSSPQRSPYPEPHNLRARPKRIRSYDYIKDTEIGRNPALSGGSGM